MNGGQIIKELFSSKGQLQPGALAFEADLKHVPLPINGNYLLLRWQGNFDRGLYSFFIQPKGRGSHIKFQFSSSGVKPTDKYTLGGTIYFWR